MPFRQNLFRAVCNIRKTLPGGIERKVGHSPLLPSSRILSLFLGGHLSLFIAPPSIQHSESSPGVLGIMTGACMSGIPALLFGGWAPEW
ncbi:hypothetical protein CEXT_199461 [Caerostris extrusa]|uniref:Uncharacterized protein n=1 Tax=Caerostris extrusa TaxID=172846 RepID=A0AAV4WUZ5_CAEEX|nr:hypothetical protein CEXT_199461 [Caerostris extrusa]